LLPVSLDVIAWLGGHYVAAELYEKAVALFDRAASIQPAESKWPLFAASCLRRTGAVPAAFARYQDIIQKFPRDIECTFYLV
jgi:tetratricopeptide (TPR) repeat protein